MITEVQIEAAVDAYGAFMLSSAPEAVLRKAMRAALVAAESAKEKTAGEETGVIIQRTYRGFLRGEFRDYNGDACSIQESSLATGPMLWLGQDSGTHRGEKCMARMLLTQEMAARLIPLLQCFAKTGRLGGGLG